MHPLREGMTQYNLNPLRRWKLSLIGFVFSNTGLRSREVAWLWISTIVISETETSMPLSSSWYKSCSIVDNSLSVPHLASDMSFDCLTNSFEWAFYVWCAEEASELLFLCGMLHFLIADAFASLKEMKLHLPSFSLNTSSLLPRSQYFFTSSLCFSFYSQHISNTVQASFSFSSVNVSLHLRLTLLCKQKMYKHWCLKNKQTNKYILLVESELSNSAISIENLVLLAAVFKKISLRHAYM